MMNRTASALLFLALTGCQAVPIASTPRTIIFNGVNDDSIRDASMQAQDHCEENGRDAELVTDGPKDGKATFTCVGE